MQCYKMFLDGEKLCVQVMASVCDTHLPPDISLPGSKIGKKSNTSVMHFQVKNTI